MGFIDDNRELLATLLAADFIQDERKLLDRRDDDLFPLGDKLAQVARALGMPDGGPNLGELFDGVANLLIEDTPICYDND